MKMTDFVAKVLNIAASDKVRREIDRRTFQYILSKSKNSDLRYLSFEEVRETHETIRRAEPLQQVF